MQLMMKAKMNPAMSASRNIFLWCMSSIYLFAFASLYVQIPGLYGVDGILPARLVLNRGHHTPLKKFQDLPTLLWFLQDYGIEASAGMELICILGIAASLVCLLSPRMRDSMTFALLWFLYLSVYQVGQTFLWFQWDSLLLETGFLTMLVAPLQLLKWKSREERQHDTITFWLIRWLLFRLMFASGVVKLTSGCPTWWGLTALNYHYESQCISTPLAWYAHQLPEWFQKLSVVGTYLIEIPVPFLFFSPIRNLKMFAFWLQVIFQIAIILTGNYNFFNLLTITLCISLLDDEDLGYSTQGKRLQGLQKLVVRLTSLLVYGLLIYWTVHYFNLSINWPQSRVDSQINFSVEEFQSFVHGSVVVGMWIGSISLACVILAAIWRSLVCVPGVFGKVWSVLQVIIFTLVAVYMFCISLPSLTQVDRDAYQNLAPIVHEWHGKSDFLQLSHSYGLFRRMTGVGGRPEVVIEGSNNLTAGWKPYEFKYKPGDISAVPAVVAPHQPRLDWQMWFAALGSARQNPWFISLIYRLLTNQEEVLDLIDHNPFPKSPPKFIRAKLYHYHFTSWSKNSKNWWRRKEVETYLSPVTKESQAITSFVQSSGLKYKSKKKTGGYLHWFLSTMRHYFGNLSGPVLIFSIFIPVLMISIFR
ncbi:lipase maturation factor 2-like isoform X2 [Apostichopus japonicus]|uniref:lipase maturation factor 2-like isoform X2 n=1 Tax=Stichopus japonicus TaxID=307972 RepID=UPI003AB61A53